MTVISRFSGFKSKGLSSETKLWSYLSIAALATIFDAYSSWRIIAVDKIAIEANPLMETLGDTFGFGWAMVLRAVFGVLALLGIWWIANQKKDARARTWGRGGLRLIAVALLCLVVYHIVGISLYS